MTAVRFIVRSTPGLDRAGELGDATTTERWTPVDVTGLTRSQIAAKQLAHNAIEGQDNVVLPAPEFVVVVK